MQKECKLIVCNFLSKKKLCYLAFALSMSQSLQKDSVTESHKVSLFVCLDDLPNKGTRQTPTTSRGYKHQAGNSQSL